MTIALTGLKVSVRVSVLNAVGGTSFRNRGQLFSLQWLLPLVHSTTMSRGFSVVLLLLTLAQLLSITLLFIASHFLL